ncbi:hypothetical protein ABH926_006265 [Catenulispora sp. GP43]|uniref:hypothetical protein n=1 Tax=Catenulispora sp. GP43 TaxID=3156263 RepID=UPI003518BE67
MTTPAKADDDEPLIPLPLKILAVISIVVHIVLLGLACIAAKSSGDADLLAADRAWDWYLVVGAAWSVGIGIFGLHWGGQATTRFGGTGSSARVGWCLAGVWLGYFWPVPVTAAAVTFALWPRRPSPAAQIRPEPARANARWRRTGVGIRVRIAAVVVAAPVAIAGSAWGLSAHAARLHQVSAASAATVVGTWRAGGMTVTLRPDGTYSASDLTAADLSDNEAYPPGTGQWDLGTTGPHELDSVELRPSQDRLLELPVYQASSIDYLCAEIDPDSPCDIVFHRE